MSASDESALLEHPLARGVAPGWAEEWGEDECEVGVWAAFRVGEVLQRLRWIPAGSFLMGSTDDEAGRWKDEGPQRLVRIERDFWLGEVPVTQELWKAVMGDDPSEFPSPRRPVESVSWERCQEFLRELNARVPGLEARLPFEVEWEYACRAGTTTSTYAGELEIRGENNAPLLDAIAWYGGNSGKEYDLEKAENSSGWPEKQYEHARAGTRIVGLKEANPWGLRDMLGNVYEWCADEYGAYPGGEAMSWGSRRVVRGGSWFSNARIVRAADRRARRPDGAHSLLGLRLARGHGCAPAGELEARVPAAEPPGDRRRSRRGGPSGARPGE